MSKQMMANQMATHTAPAHSEGQSKWEKLNKGGPTECTHL